MSDKLVFDLAQEVEGTPNVFVRKDWINILDNQNQNYNNNQSVIDTSQLSNSNKYMSYRESYFSMPFLLTLQSQPTSGTSVAAGAGTQQAFSPQNRLFSADYAVGLKNWFGQIIHSFTLDYNGTTIIQQTPYINIWNSFKLMTSLSMSDVRTQGCTIGFYPDCSTSWGFTPSVQIAAVPAGNGTGNIPIITPYSLSGQGVSNNTNVVLPDVVSFSGYANYNAGKGNIGFLKRQQYINFDGDALSGSYAASLLVNAAGSYSAYAPYSYLQQGSTATTCNQIWKSYIYNKFTATGVTTNGYWQCAIIATIYLKHIHSFFNMCPLLKGVFMKMTMNLNNTSTQFQAISQSNGVNQVPIGLSASLVSNPLGGVNPVMISSADVSGAIYASPPIDPPLNTTVFKSDYNGSISLFQDSADAVLGASSIQNYRVNISVGASCLDSTMTTAGYQKSPLSQSVYLYIPAYTFNPVFEQAYLSSPVKQIKYTDIYQYQVLTVQAGSNFNNLLTNGIANIKSVLIMPFYSASAGAISPIVGANTVGCNSNTGFIQGVPVWQSPFDPAGTGPTSPLCAISNFNIQVSGQNAIYNVEKYNFEQFNNQLYGQNAVNGGLTDGLTSGLIDRLDFDMEYCYYYVNVERMLPVEQSVPKSIQILGQNYSSRALDLYCFIEYGVDISIDALTGARV